MKITKEQDWKQKLGQDFLQLKRVRSTNKFLWKRKGQIFNEEILLGVLIKKLKRLNRSNTCSNDSTNLLDKTSVNAISIASN